MFPIVQSTSSTQFLHPSVDGDDGGDGATISRSEPPQVEVLDPEDDATLVLGVALDEGDESPVGPVHDAPVALEEGAGGGQEAGRGGRGRELGEDYLGRVGALWSKEGSRGGWSSI